MKPRLILIAFAALFSGSALASSCQASPPDNDVGIHVSDLGTPFTIQCEANISFEESFAITNVESYQFANQVKIEKLPSLKTALDVPEAPRICYRQKESHYLFSHSLVYFDDHPKG
jgi:hypothetical protein